MQIKHTLSVGLVFLLISSFGVMAEDNASTQVVTPSIATGAKVFKKRCTLCHGSVGMGEGLLSMALDNYPSTNILDNRFGNDDETLRNIIIWGGADGKKSEYSPPWGNELTWTEIESLVLFIKFFRSNTDEAIAMLKKQQVKTKPSLKVGRNIFQSRCARCHGKTGEGNGKMAKIIKNPPPFNLTKSIMPDEYLRQIISRGGAAMYRSPSMPPWGDELSSNELESVIKYIKSLRTTE